MSKPVLVIGAGGHAAVLVDILRLLKRPILAIVSPNTELKRAIFENIKHLNHDDDILQYTPDEVELVNGIGSIPNGSKKEQLRVKLYSSFKSKGYQFSNVISPQAIISPFATLAEGAQVMPNAVIQAGAFIGENSIINTSVVIEHDCQIGAHNHIAPGVIISGDVNIQDHVHIGTGVSIIQGINIQKNSIVGAGATITKDVLADTITHPARNFVKGKTV